MNAPLEPGTGADLAVVTTTVPVTALTFCEELLNQLADRGYRPLVVSSPGAELAHLHSRGVVTEAIPMKRAISPLADLVALLRWVRLLLRLRPTVVLAATPKAALLALTAAWVTRVPQRVYLLWGLRLEGESGRRRHLLALMERITGAAATSIVANSPSLAAKARDLRLFRHDRFRTTRPGSSHGVDADHFRPELTDRSLLVNLGLDPHLPTLGFIGRLTHDKGIDTLVGALRRLRARGAACQMLVVSPADEPDSAHYRRLLGTLGVPVAFSGPQRDVRPYFGVIDVLVLPSLREGFPNVVLEAAAMAVPTITTSATGCVDSVVPGETGLVHAPGDDIALTRCIEDLIRDPDLRGLMGAQARARVVADFPPDRTVHAILTLAGVVT